MSHGTHVNKSGTHVDDETTQVHPCVPLSFFFVFQDIALKVHIHWCTCTMSHSTRTQMNESRVNKSVTHVDDDVTKK